MSGDLLDDVLHRRDACGPPKPRNAVFDGRLVRQTVPVNSTFGNEVGVLGVQQRPLHDGQRQVGREAAVGEEVGFERGDPPSSAKPTSYVAEYGWRLPVVRKSCSWPKTHAGRPAASCGRRGRRASPACGLRFLAAEAAAHALQTQTTWPLAAEASGDDGLNLGRVLRGRMDGDRRRLRRGSRARPALPGRNVPARRCAIRRRAGAQPMPVRRSTSPRAMRRGGPMNCFFSMASSMVSTGDDASMFTLANLIAAATASRD